MNKWAAVSFHSCIIWVCKSRWRRSIVVCNHCFRICILKIDAWLFWICLHGKIRRRITIPGPLNCNSKFSPSDIIFSNYWLWIILNIVIRSNSSLSSSINLRIYIHLYDWSIITSSEASIWYYILWISYCLKVNRS